jgi:hypothetical protein
MLKLTTLLKLLLEKLLVLFLFLLEPFAGLCAVASTEEQGTMKPSVFGDCAFS